MDAVLLELPEHGVNDNNDGENLVDPGGHRHQRSIRFMKPQPGHRRSVAPFTSGNRPQTANFRLSAIKTEGHPFSQADSIEPRPPPESPKDITYLNALQEPEDYYTTEDDIASAPSSFRRLRKSKSTISHSRPTYNFNNGSPPHSHFRSHTLRSSMSNDKESCRPSSGILPSLRAPKSMTFLTGNRQQPSTRSTHRENDLAVEMAREMFQESVEQQKRHKRLNSRPSRFFGSRSKHSKSTTDLRHDLQKSSNNTIEPSLPTPTASLGKQRAGFKTKARKVSSNIKNKLRKILHRPKKDEPGTTLALEDAKTPNELEDDDMNIQMGPGEFPHAQCSVVHGPSRVPALHTICVEDQLCSRKGSMDTLKSVRETSDDKSRVTSWTSSGVESTSGNTTEWDKQRPTVVREFGAHASPGSLQQQVGARASNFSSLNVENIPPYLRSIGPGRIVDSERVYSALVKREKEKAVLRRDSQRSLRHTDLAGGRTPTIRLVKSEDDVLVDNLGIGASPQARTPSVGGVAIRRPAVLIGHVKTLVGGGSLTSDPDLSESPHIASFRGSSAYRLALKEKITASMEEVDSAQHDFNYTPCMSNLSLRKRSPSTKSSETDQRHHYASSVYSSAANSPEFPSLPGAAVKEHISGTVRYYPGDSTKVTPNLKTYDLRREVDGASSCGSAASSVEWKMWLSADVSKSEAQRDTHRFPSGVRYSMPKMPKSFGHIREATEIESSSSISTPTTYQPRSFTPKDPEEPPALQPVDVNAVGLAKPNCPRAFKLSVTSTASQISTMAPQYGENAPPLLMEGYGVGTEVCEPLQSPMPPIPHNNPLRSAPSLPTLRTPTQDAAPGFVGATSDEPRTVPNIGPRSTVLMKTMNATMGKLPQQRGYPSVSRRPSLPRLSNVYSTGSPLSKADLKAATAPRTPEALRLYHSLQLETPNDSSPRAIGSPEFMGSGKMVDLFLSSRRRKIVGNEDTEAFV